MSASLLPPDTAAYAAVIAEVQAFVAALPLPLPALGGPTLERLSTGTFSPIVALLPHWLCAVAAVPAATAHQLGVAQFCGWWYISVQDDLLDGSAAAVDLLCAHLALLHAVALLRDLGLAEHAGWPAFAALAATSAAGYAEEWAAPTDPVTYTPALVVRRGALFQFATLAQLDLAGVPHGAPLRADLCFVLDQLVLARQLRDDAADWALDLRRGRLNLVSAAFARDLPAADRTAERLAGHQLVAEPIWANLAEQHATICATALGRLQPYAANQVLALLAAEAAAGVQCFAELQAQRIALRRSLGIAA